jgi:hypothetical protein
MIDFEMIQYSSQFYLLEYDSNAADDAGLVSYHVISCT